MRGRLAAHHWGGTVAITVLVAVIGFLSRTETVELPFLQDVVPARLMVAIGVPVIALTPLYAAFPGLSATFVREPVLRPLRLLAVMGLAVVGYAPAALGVEEEGVSTDTTFFLVLMAIALAALVIGGDYAWFFVLAAGFTALVVDSSPSMPVSRAMVGLTLPVAIGLVAALGVTYAVCGPRTTRA